MRTLIRHFLQKFGYDIVKFNPKFETGKLDKAAIETEYKWLQDRHFNTIIDIGANDGQFAEKMRILFPDAAIHAFEPLPESFQNIKVNFKNDRQFTVYNVALGEEDGHLSFHRNEYTPSSSLLTLASEHISHFDHATKTNTIVVNVTTLDKIFTDEELKSPVLIKIDVQGFEDKVIKGGLMTLQKADMIICELSFSELFKGQVLFDEIYNTIISLGFRYIGSLDQLRSPRTNAILQADGIFIKR